MHLGVPCAERVRKLFSIQDVHRLMPMARYWNNEEQTRSAVRRHPGDDTNLWMHTGDKGVMDNDGYLRSECCERRFPPRFRF